MAYNPQNSNGQKIMDNSAPVVIASNQSDLPVDIKSLEGFYDAGNSSTTPLAGGGVFTGAAIEITNYSAINVAVYSDVASATNGFQMQFSPNGTNWDHTHSFTLSTVPGGASYAQSAELRYFRIVYTNGASAQATFRLTTILKPTNVSPSRYTVEQAVTATQMADVVKSVIYGKTTGGGGGYVDVKVNPSGAMITATTLDAGTASIGVLGANSGVDIGDVTINNAAGASAVNIQDGGNSITVDGNVGQLPINSGGLTPVTGASTGGGNVLFTVTGPLQVYGWYFYNNNTAPAYVTFYNSTIAPGGVGTGFTYVIVVPPYGGANAFGMGIAHSTLLSIGIASTRTGTGVLATAVDYTIFYKA